MVSLRVNVIQRKKKSQTLCFACLTGDCFKQMRLSWVKCLIAYITLYNVTCLSCKAFAKCDPSNIGHNRATHKRAKTHAKNSPCDR